MYAIKLPIIHAKGYWDYSTPGWPLVSPTYKEIEEKKDWCKNHVGTNMWNYYGLYQKSPCEFKFKNEEDLLAFRIRFGI